MKAQHIFTTLLIGGALTTLTACKDFVDLEPISEATTINAYTTAKGAEAALTSIYDQFSQEYYIWDNIVLSDVISDNYYAGGDDPQIFAVDKLDLSPTNGRFYNDWSQLYTSILRANTVLKRVPLINDPTFAPGRQDQILGEAAFLRALHYFNLVKNWGPVPLILDPTESPAPAVTNVPRSSEKEVYDQIIKDLEFAIAKLPDTYGGDASISKARATKGAANALLAKAYAQRADRDYSKVLQYCNSVIGSPAGYKLLENYPELFDGAHYNNAESIMEVQFVGGNEANWGPQMLLPPSVSGDGWRKFVTPSKNLVAAFDSEGDVVRKNSSILFEAIEGWVDEFWGNTKGASIPFAYKWKSASGWASTNRQYIVRLADIILLRAEALNELGRTAEARSALDSIRRRAGLQPSTTSTQMALRAAILKERRLELCQEGQRWDDLKRAGIAVETMNNLNEIDLRTNQRVNYNMTSQKLLLPIPQQELNRNKKLEQNPGYN